MLSLVFLIISLSEVAAQFSVQGNKIFYNGSWVKFKGIGLTCTEYMMKPGMDDSGKGEWPGHWAYNYCFGGPPSAGATPVLNNEVPNVLKFLTGSQFATKPSVAKVALGSPYDQIMDNGSPSVMPIARIPLCGSCYLYDDDNDGGGHLAYQQTIDIIVQGLTGKGVAVILDLHWNCPDSTHISGCTGAQAAMALKNYGSYPGSLTLWDTISSKYKSNPLVLFELYNEPWIGNFTQWYSGDNTWAGMKEMYNAVRKNAPTNLVVIGGKDQYALDAQSGLAYYIQYKADTGSYPTNIVWNIHPYVGSGQGLEHSLGSAMRLALALKTIGPVIFTEFGQYCCGTKGTPCQGSGQCSDHNHGDWFVFNVANMAEQYDLSWIGWGWRGTNVNNAHRPCTDGQCECNQPDMRDTNGLTDGTAGGADWKQVWATFVTPTSIKVQDIDPDQKTIAVNYPQLAGFLPRPCIVPGFNLNDVCGYDLNTDVTTIPVNDLITQSLYVSFLPGLPPRGNCSAQGCPTYTCETYTGPCKK
jgi:hypothetical protein